MNDFETYINKVIETPRLFLRQLEWSDQDALQSMLSNPDIMHFKGGTKGEGAAYRMIKFAKADYGNKGYGFWAIAIARSESFIGVCGLLDQEVDGEAEVEVAYSLLKPYWGRGYATEAARGVKHYGFTAFGFKRLVSLIHPENKPSIAVAMRIGMSYERDTIFKDFPARVYAASNK